MSVDVPIETSSNISVYDGIPVINRIEFGFYAIPGDHDIVSYIQSVDNGAFGPHEHYDISGYISSLTYTNLNTSAVLSDPYVHMPAYLSTYDLSTCEYGKAQLVPLSTAGDTYANVDKRCSLEPYVDKIYWTIDADSIYTYPNNVKWERG